MQASSRLVVPVLAGLVALGPLSTDMYLPALPTLQRVFAAEVGEVQLTLSLFLVGFAIGQLGYGSLADRFGRRPVLIGGMLIFLLASLGCVHATTIEQLIVLRLLQAIGGCAAPVLGRAMVRDLYGPRDAAQILSYLGTAMALAPAVAPIIGGYLLSAFGWPAIFQFLVLLGVVVLLLVTFVVGETQHNPDPTALRLGRLRANYGQLFRDRRYRGYVLSCSFVFSGLFAFLSGSPFVIIDYFGFGPEQYGYLFVLIVAGYMTGTLLSARLGRYIPLDRLLWYGALLSGMAGLTMALLSLVPVDHVAAVIGPHSVFMVGVGIVMPQAMAGAIAPYPQMTGVASALLGFLQMAIAAAAGTLVGLLHDGSPWPMAGIIAVTGLAAALVSYGGRHGSEEASSP